MTDEATSHSDIAKALAAAQKEMGSAQKTEENSHFKSKYADLASVREACLPALNKHGIAVIQPVIPGDISHVVKTTLLHESGEKLECDVPLLLGKQDMQGLGAAITYARRYGLMAMAGVAPAEDEDDDGEGNRRGNPMGAALNDAWTQGVLDNLPENASPRDKAEAFAETIIDGFSGKKERALQNEWGRREKLIGQFESRFPDLFEKVVDAFENRMMEVTGTDVPRQAAE